MKYDFVDFIADVIACQHIMHGCKESYSDARGIYELAIVASESKNIIKILTILLMPSKVPILVTWVGTSKVQAHPVLFSSLYCLY